MGASGGFAGYLRNWSQTKNNKPALNTKLRILPLALKDAACVESSSPSVTIILDSSAPSPRCFPRLTGPAAAWRLPDYIHFLRNALDYLPRKVADDCLAELRWLYDRRNAESLKILDFLSVPISSLRFSGIM
jgi:hypothetical protein